MAESRVQLSENARKFLSSGSEASTLEPPGKELAVSSNFFDADIDDAMNILDIEAMDGVVQTWRQEAHKKLKKRPSVAVEYRPEDTKQEVIGGTLIADDKIQHRPSTQSTAIEPPQSLPVGTITDHQASSRLRNESLPVDLSQRGAADIPKGAIPRGTALTKSRTSENLFSRIQVPEKSREVFVAPSIERTIDMILIGQPYVLEWYKSLEDKRALLLEAIRTHDGNAIITVILFLRNTLSKSLFEVLLLNHPVAASHYCSFLRQNEAWESLKSVYYVLGEESYGILQYQQCLTQQDIPRRMQSLESCRILFEKKPTLSKDAVYIQEYTKLLRRQRNIESFQKSKPVQKYQGPSLVDSTLITTLTYCCRYHLNNPEVADVSPEEFKKDFSIPEKQYFVVLLMSLCVNRDWETIDRLLTPTGWQSKLKLNTKIKAPVSVERVLNVVGNARFRAPEEMLCKYLRMIDDIEHRLKLATRYKCYGVGIEVLKQLKDNKRLKEYVMQIPTEKQRKYRPMLAKMFS